MTFHESSVSKWFIIYYILCGIRAIHPAAVRRNENKKKTLCALAEDSKPEVTFKQYKKKAFTHKTGETYRNKRGALLKLSSSFHLPPDSDLVFQYMCFMAVYCFKIHLHITIWNAISPSLLRVIKNTNVWKKTERHMFIFVHEFSSFF